MTKKYKILILGASYGSLLATKLALAGHDAKMVCLPAEAELVNREGTRVRMEQSGFRLDQTQASGGATYGWNRFFEGLEGVLSQQG